jgi:hypothetical protein
LEVSCKRSALHGIPQVGLSQNPRH